VTLAKVEEAYRHEKETKEAIEEVIRSYSLYQLQDTLDAAEEGTDENRLLPAMNKIWPFLVACVRNKNPVVRIHLFLLEVALCGIPLVIVLKHCCFVSLVLGHFFFYKKHWSSLVYGFRFLTHSKLHS
jgi:hypothetical protein